MSEVYFISDLHLGHKNILAFSRPEFTTLKDHDDHIINTLKNIIKERDVLWILGDVAFNEEALERMLEIPGRKNLVRGNHDVHSTARYARLFEGIYGIVKYKGFWLSHAPIHPAELRGKKNIHGHVHRNSIQLSTPIGEIVDQRYVNVCAEVVNYVPRSLTELKNVPIN